MKRKALGKGLSSLIPSAPASARVSPTPQVAPVAPPPAELKVEISSIRPNRRQPRQAFDQEALADLARSIKTTGLLQPVVVRPLHGGGYELIAGERRWRAAQKAGVHRIPAIVRDVPDDRLLELALIENLQREELNAIEEAEAYRVLVADLGLTQAEVAERVGKQRSTVANALRLLDLPGKVQDLVRSRRLSMGHARALLALEDADAIVELATRVAEAGLSVREVEARVKRRSGPVARSPRETTRDPNVAAAEGQLQRALGTRVRIAGGAKRGKVEIHYHSEEELDRVYKLLIDASKRRQ